MSEQTPTADLTALARAIIGLLPLSDDGTAHVADCGYTHDNPTCGCYTLPSRIAEQITAAGFGPVRAVEADLSAHAARLLDEVGRANRAEAREKALRESVEALDRGHSSPCVHPDDACVCVISLSLFDLRALLDASPDREDGAS